MSAPELRKAATKMRDRAEKAEPGPYGFTSKWTTPRTMLTRITLKGRTVAEARSDGPGLYDLLHLSYWHPAVAFAVAAWLDSEADRLADLTHAIPNVVVSDGVLREWGFGHALDVARAYLGGAA